MGQLEGLDRRRGGLADHVELALQRVRHDDVRAAADEDLADHRLLGTHGGRHRHLAVDRHVAPAEQHLALGLDRALHLLLAGQTRGVFLRQEDHAHAVFAGRRQRDALRGHLGAVELVRDLDQDAGAVAHQLVGTDGAAVIQVLQDLEALLDDAMCLLALDVGHEADTAGVVFVLRVVEALRAGEVEFGVGHSGGQQRIHGVSPDARKGDVRIVQRSK